MNKNRSRCVHSERATDENELQREDKKNMLRMAKHEANTSTEQQISYRYTKRQANCDQKGRKKIYVSLVTDQIKKKKKKISLETVSFHLSFSLSLFDLLKFQVKSFGINPGDSPKHSIFVNQ